MLLHFRLLLCVQSPLSFQSRLTPPQYLVTRFLQPTGNANYCFKISSLMVFPEILSDILSLLRHSCFFKPWFLVPLRPSSFARHLFPNVRPVWVLGIVSFLPCPWRPCPLRCATLAWWVAANFFWDPPSPWVLFFGFWWCSTATAWSLWHFFSGLKVPTAASSLGISAWSDYQTAVILDLPPSFLDRHPTWP
jgi:hypothetical protein